MTHLHRPCTISSRNISRTPRLKRVHTDRRVMGARHAESIASSFGMRQSFRSVAKQRAPVSGTPRAPPLSG
jgi:hypothetical protein